MKPRRKPSKRKKGVTIRELKALSRALVFARDGHRCIVCRRGKEDGVQLQWSHVVSQKVASTRFLTDNIMCHCAGDHFAWHAYPTIWAVWWVAKFPERHRRVLAQMEQKAPTKEQWKERLLAEGKRA